MPTPTTTEDGVAVAGDIITVELPWSEVCMHMRLAGQVREVLVLSNGAQILRPGTVEPDGGPITHGEAGLYRHTVDGRLVLRYRR